MLNQSSLPSSSAKQEWEVENDFMYTNIVQSTLLDN